MTNQISSQRIKRCLLSHTITTEKKGPILHVHQNAYEVTLFKRGNVDYFVNDAMYHLKAGNLLLIRPHDIHGYTCKDTSPYERLSVHIEENLAASLSSDTTDLLSCFTSPHHSAARRINSEQMKMFEYYTNQAILCLNEQNFGHDIQVCSYLSMILIIANTASQNPDALQVDSFPPFIQNAIAYINANFSNDISIQDIADNLNISRSRLCHAFKEFTGAPLWNYVIARRIQEAEKLLKQGASITAACYESGFQDYAHFAKTFRQFTGMSPGKYTKNSGKKDPNIPMLKINIT